MSNDLTYSIIGDLAEANIIYLDDQPGNLRETAEIFLEQGIRIRTSESIEDTKLAALDNSANIVLCDLRLDDIKNAERGDHILRFIRNRKKGVFLALFTAHKNDLNQYELTILKNNNIYIYEKDDHTEFILNLARDYRMFITERQTSERNYDDTFDTEVSGMIRDQVLKHLRNISNQDVTVPLPGERDIRVRDLIQQVEESTNIGRKYIKAWVHTLVTIQNIRKAKGL